MPRIRLMTATSISISIRLPPDSNSTISVMTRPMPVSDTVPTMMPAAAVATPMPIMLRAPVTRPSIRSSTPWRAARPKSLRPRNQEMMGFCVSMTKIMNIVAQKADKPGDICSTIRHQINTTTANR